MLGTHFLHLLLTSAFGSRAILADKAGTEAYLASHTEITIGRDALKDARAKIQGEHTFTIYQKPIENVVLIQEFDASTNERLYAVALIDDQQAEDYYKKHAKPINEKAPVQKRCSECGGGGPHCDRAVDVDMDPGRALFERASRCRQFCGRSYPQSNVIPQLFDTLCVD